MVTCLNKCAGIETIIQRFTLAANGLYKHRNWSSDEIDLATLVLRIGGPGLLYAFNRVSLLPSTLNFIHCSFKHHN